MSNLARFKIDGVASTTPGHDVIHNAAGTLQLETPSSEVWKVTFSVADATDVNAPLASKASNSAGLNAGCTAFISATTPAMCGAAMEVP
jgi:hypothetical protein